MLFAGFCLLGIAQKRYILIVHPRIFWIFPFEKARTMVLPYPSMDSRRKIHTNQKANSKRHKAGEIKKNNYFSLVGRQVKFKVESKSLRRS